MKLHRIPLLIAGCLTVAAIVPAARYVDAGSPVAGTGGCTGLVLTLQPGQVAPNGRLVRRAPSNMPRGPILLGVPLPSGAKPAQQSLANPPDEDMPLTPYVKTAVREFRVPADQSQLMAWYARSFYGCGYTNDGYGTAGGPSGSTAFRDFKDPALQEAAVAVSFESAGNGTLVVYYGNAVIGPNRSPRTTIRHLRSVRITYHPSLHVTRRVVIPGGRLAQVMAGAFDALPRDVGGVGSCPADFGLGASLIFTSPGGRVQRARVDYACEAVSIGGQGFDDVGDNAWNATGYVVYKWLFSHPRLRG